MPKCNVCAAILPPDFCNEVASNVYKCLFCERGNNIIYYGEDKQKTAKKEEIIKEYQIFLKQLSQTHSVESIIKGAEDKADKEVLKVE